MDSGFEGRKGGMNGLVKRVRSCTKNLAALANQAGARRQGSVIRKIFSHVGRVMGGGWGGGVLGICMKRKIGRACETEAMGRGEM